MSVLQGDGQRYVGGLVNERDMRWESNYAKKFEWQKWFAWYPVYFNGFYHWLTFVERRWEQYNPYDGEWEYRLIK